MKRRAFLALGILPVIAVAPVIIKDTLPKGAYSYYEDGPQSAFGLAPIKREGSSVRFKGVVS